MTVVAHTAGPQHAYMCALPPRARTSLAMHTRTSLAMNTRTSLGMNMRTSLDMNMRTSLDMLCSRAGINTTTLWMGK